MAEPRRIPRASSLASIALWVVLLAAAAFTAFALNTVEQSNRRLQQGVDAQGTVISQLATGLDTTRKQLKQHGVTPKAPAASSIVQGVQGVPGIPGPAGPSGTPGSPGATGAAGSPGPSGAPGQSGRNGSPGSAGSPGAAGASGQPGSAGSPGTTGVAGAAGAQGPKGDTGSQGPKGDTGDTGAQGPAGPAPSGWTFTYTDTLGKSTTYNCAPDSDGSTHYTCTPTSTSGPLKTSKTPAKNAVALLGFTGLAAYRRLDPTRRGN